HILVGFILPGLVILVCYCIMISSLSQGAKGQVQKKKKKKKVLKMTVVLIVCFFSCWLPYCVGILVDTLTMLNVIVSSIVAYIHCCLNPILYAFLVMKFNQTPSSMLTIISSTRWSQKATPVTNK
ncbi:hypothetical protein GOODEAATRI_029457, partial [Goodea atripinnis]